MIILFLTIFTWNHYCDNIDHHIQEIHKLNKSIPLKGWEEEFIKEESPVFKNYLLFNVIDDTIFNIDFDVFFDLQSQKYEYRILKFWKRFNDDSYEYHLLMNIDTLYFYITPINKSEEKYFFQGKYYYMYSSPREYKFKECQYKYFIENMDSLIKVKGNDLPDLPCLEYR